MSDRDGGGGAPLDGAFLLQLLRRPPQSQPAASPVLPLPHEVLPPHRDPAVAAVGPFLPHSFLPPPRSTPPVPVSEHYPEPYHFVPPPVFARDPWRPPGFVLPGPGADYITRPSPSNHHTNPGYPQRNGVTGGDNSPHNFPTNRASGSRGIGERGMQNTGPRFPKGTVGGAAGVSDGIGNWMEKGRNSNPGPRRHESFPRPGTADQRRTNLGSFRKGQGEWVSSKGRRDGMHSVEKVDYYQRKENNRPSPSLSEADRLQGEWSGGRPPIGEAHQNSQLDQYRNTLNSNLNSVEGLDGEDYLNHPQNEDAEGNVYEVRRLMKHSTVDSITTIEDDCEEQYMLTDQLMDSQMLNGDLVDGKVKRHPNGWRGKDLRSDSFRGHHVSSQRMRIWRRGMECRQDIETLSSCFISIYESLIPAEVEKDRQKQLLLSLENLVTKEWPNARLHLYGSCANSFGVSKSDIDICLAIEDLNMSKSDILLKLADILQADNLENVQALTHARVPIVKMMDPVTGISCDICINNLLAVVNTKLLRDYAQIDERLRQLAFIVKHWAKSRGVNETYRGTLSSYAYVLMCIHFLQLRKPAILPCLQEMESTYVVTVDDTRCAYYDQVENLRGFGVRNKENIARLLWAFFHYWAYCHDYTNDVISVRTGRMISKRMKDWTRRIGNDRHLICIEDPFETAHDLGRVVDKFSIKILREEFERAAEILQNDPDPSKTLFEPYVPESTQN